MLIQVFFICWSKIIYVDGEVCLGRFFISLRFFRLAKPWPIHRVFWVAMVILSPFIQVWWSFKRNRSPFCLTLRMGYMRLQGIFIFYFFWGVGGGVWMVVTHAPIISCQWVLPSFVLWMSSVCRMLSRSLNSGGMRLHPKLLLFLILTFCYETIMLA